MYFAARVTDLLAKRPIGSLVGLRNWGTYEFCRYLGHALACVSWGHLNSIAIYGAVINLLKRACRHPQ